MSRRKLTSRALQAAWISLASCFPGCFLAPDPLTLVLAESALAHAAVGSSVITSGCLMFH
jgi:hypothetical protein